MRNSFTLALLAATCCFALAHEVKGDVNAITEVSYYEPTNSIFAWAEVTVDYETLAYYCFDNTGIVREDDNVLTMFWGGSCENNSAYYEGFFPYDPEADYSIEVLPQLTSKHHFPIGDGYEDFYNYIQWTNGIQVHDPYYFGFTGPGPATEIDFSTILLGGVYSFFTQGMLAEAPHHLWVFRDRNIIRTDLCGQAQKEIDFQIVDQHNRPAGRYSIDERPWPNLRDSCSNQEVVLNLCSDIGVAYNGDFTDFLKTGCPSSGPDTCGFDLFNQWRWCRRSTPYFIDKKALAWMYYDVRRGYVKVDGEQDMTDNQPKFP